MSNATYISTTDTAKAIRKALKVAFPSVAFSVKSSKYSGGSSISVAWTDGPTDKEISAVTNKFEGASFDGMTDLKSYQESEYNGQRVQWGANYVFTNRRYSADFLRRRAQDVATRWGFAVPAVIVNEWGGVNVEEDWSIRVGCDTLAAEIMKKAHRTRAAA